MARFSPFTFIGPYIEPAEQLSNLLFGLMMALIITVRERLEPEDDTKQDDLLFYILGGNVAWGLIQGWLYVIDAKFRRGYNARLVQSVQQAESEEEALELIADELDPTMVKVTSAAVRASLCRDIYGAVKGLEVPATKLKWADLYGAIAVFLLITATAIPAMLPFFFIDNLRLAIRVSNWLVMAIIFLVGYRWATLTNVNPWAAGFKILVSAAVLVIIAAFLNG